MPISVETFLTLEASLTARLFDTWLPIYERISAAIIKAVENNSFEDVEKAVSLIKLERAMTGNVKYAKTIGKSAMIFGASRLSEVEDIRAIDEPGSKDNITKATKQISMGLEYSSKKIRAHVAKLALDEIERKRIGGKSLKKKGIVELAEGLGGKFARGESDINLAASLHTSRLATNGYLVESKLLNQKTYRINSVLDVRTCPVCDFMNETIFKVEMEYERIQKVFAAETIDDLKRDAPWPGSSKASLESLSSMTSSEIQEAGYGSPPFHPLCRCIIDEDETGQVLVEEVQSNIPGMGAINPPSISQLEQKVKNKIIPRSGSVSLAGIDDLSTANQIVETLSQQVEKRGLLINNVETVSRGKFLTRMRYTADTGEYTLKINKTALNGLGGLTDVNAVYAAGDEEGMHLARNLEEAVIHDYGVRAVTKKAMLDDLATTFPVKGSLQAEQGLVSSAAELYLKSEVSVLSVEELEFLNKYLEWI